MEVWKDVNGYEGKYQINIYGVVKKLEMNIMVNGFNQHYKERKLKNITNKRGYVFVGLYNKGKKITYSIHRLIAKHFILNPENKPEVNHKNGIRNDNSIGNLEWVTHKENMQHAHDTGLSKISDKCKILLIERNKLYIGAKHYMSKPVVDVISGEKYESISDAAKKTGIGVSILYDRLRGRRKNNTNLVYA